MTARRTTPTHAALAGAALTALFTLSLPASAAASPPASVAATAAPTTAPRSERRDGDAAAYERLLRDRGFDVETMSRAAEAHAQAGSVGRAVLWLERVLLVAPRDTLARERLAALRGDAGVDDRRDGAWHAVAGALSTTEWSLAGGCALIALALAVVLSSSRRRVALLAGGAAAGLLVVSGLALRTLAQRADTAIVVGDDAAVRISPFATAEAAFRVRPGQSVVVGDAHGAFVRVRAADGAAGGAEGWIAQEDIARVRPGHAGR